MRFLTLLLAPALAQAAYTSHYGPRTPVEVAPRSTQTCTVKASGNNYTDDTPNINAVFQQCKANAVVVFEQGVD